MRATRYPIQLAAIGVEMIPCRQDHPSLLVGLKIIKDLKAHLLPSHDPPYYQAELDVLVQQPSVCWLPSMALSFWRLSQTQMKIPTIKLLCLHTGCFPHRHLLENNSYQFVTCVHVPVTVHRSGQCSISYVELIYIRFIWFDFSSATVSESDRLCYRITMFSLLCWKFIFRIPGMKWSCNTGESWALFVCFFLWSCRITGFWYVRSYW